MTPEEQAALAAAQDPAPAVPQPVATPPAAPAPGPWAQDLAQFTDPAVQAQVDEMLRSKWQPRMTQLEQKAADAADAQHLLDDLRNNPAATMEALAAELQWQQSAAEPDPPVTPPAASEMDPRVQALIDAEDQRQAQALYQSEMDRIVATHPGLDPEDMHPFVVSADGNFDQAVLLRNAYVERWNTANAAPVEPAPPVLGGETGAVTPPVTQPILSIKDTVAQFLANNTPGDAPPVS